MCLSTGDEGSVPDLHLIKQVEQVTSLASGGPARQSGDGSEQWDRKSEMETPYFAIGGLAAR